jgi:hypothetical protein
MNKGCQRTFILLIDHSTLLLILATSLTTDLLKIESLVRLSVA